MERARTAVLNKMSSSVLNGDGGEWYECRNGEVMETSEMEEIAGKVSEIKASSQFN